MIEIVIEIKNRVNKKELDLIVDSFSKLLDSKKYEVSLYLWYSKLLLTEVKE